MCVISFYEKGLVLNKSELENCFTGNPDGAGMMYQTGNKIHIEKGFMDFPSFWAAAEKLPANVDRVFHFRIATSGKVSAACCHPFPVCDDYKKMSFAKCDTPMGFAHNGVLSEFTPKKGMKSSVSDTMVFNRDMLSRLGNLIKYSSVRDLLELYTTSRFAIMTPEQVYIIGGWEQSRESGAFYSNNSYSGYRYKNCSKWMDWADTQYSNYWEDYANDEYDYSRYFYIPEYLTEKETEDVLDKLEDTFNVFVYDYDICVDDKRATTTLYYEGKDPKKFSGSVTLNGRKINWFRGKLVK